MSARKRARLTPPGGAGAGTLHAWPATAADPLGAVELPSTPLDLLLQPLQALLMPRLRLADVQCLGQACRAMRALVHGLPDATLGRLAQARARLVLAGVYACSRR